MGEKKIEKLLSVLIENKRLVTVTSKCLRGENNFLEPKSERVSKGADT